MGYTDIDVVTKKFGAESAKELALFMAEHVYAMKEVAEKEKLDCDFVLTRRVEAFLHQPHADHLKGVYERQLEEGLDYIEDVDFVNQKFVERVSSVMQISSLNLILTLLTALWN